MKYSYKVFICNWTIILLFFLIYYGYKKISSMDQVPVVTKPVKTETQEISKEPNEKKTETLEILPQEVINNTELDELLKSKNFNGTAVIVKNGNIIINKGYGMANQEQQIPNNSQTSYYLGSLTKAIVATAIMQLKDQQKLQVDDEIAKYIPNFPRGNEITLKHLLTHTSGIPEHDEGEEQISHDELIKKISKQKLLFTPGSKWSYSDSNYAILAYILEKVSGKNSEVYIKENIFDVAGMKHSGFGEKFIQEKYPSTGYKIKDGTVKTPTLPHMSQLFGSGDIYTTAHDLYLFDEALYTSKLISKESFTEMVTPVKKNYGYGWYAESSYSAHGVMPGWNLLNSFNRNGSVYVVLLSNIQNNLNLGSLNNDIYIFLQNIA
ncbi:serine hydrolase domain-containing protein [Bacillus toyonensis]|uniref:Penicillin-binding protein n=2 Tax=Bacillus toyonensis TaxID=155322 RepID=A0A2B5CPG9_9BACI|nr:MULTISPECIES: serine hydrolase domain-containing protein [Bacillus cereus group]PEJ30944.1 penicillin-binding protein [Bacillus pseudomycoides]PEJ99061.1 penicillin-binding protein [Bacillus toyonensis]PEL22101.1 penicillin-binding protein [Bacillus toyonensis]PFY53797.1 penicillin-binding protein [Bacillus toyonensis]PGA78995.1 penicillin-binding protein [Bacillus toyonensis]